MKHGTVIAINKCDQIKRVEKKKGGCEMKKIIANLEEYICAGLLLMIVISTLLQVLSRYLIGSPIGWTEELARFLMIWLVFFGASAGIKRQEHIKVEFFLQKMPEKLRKVVIAGSMAITAIFLIILIYQGALLTIQMSSVPAVTMPITIAYIYLAIPIGCLFILLRLIQYRTL